MESKLPKFACFSNKILYKKEAIELNFKIEKCMYIFICMYIHLYSFVMNGESIHALKMLPVIFIVIFKILRKKLMPYSYFF